MVSSFEHSDKKLKQKVMTASRGKQRTTPDRRVVSTQADAVFKLLTSSSCNNSDAVHEGVTGVSVLVTEIQVVIEE
ncbi:hypothetical protein MalM14_27140 [Gimesia chilikensis]|nr:hypothetical protein MalM14_27140 [Gimesia chilikensis]